MFLVATKCQRAAANMPCILVKVSYHVWMHVAGHEGNIDDMARIIEEHEVYGKELDYTARPGTKTYPRFKDTLLGCFKAGRYSHLVNTHRKVNGKTIYRLDEKALK